MNDRTPLKSAIHQAVGAAAYLKDDPHLVEVLEQLIDSGFRRTHNLDLGEIVFCATYISELVRHAMEEHRHAETE